MHGASSGSRDSRIYVTLDISVGSSDGGGHRRMTWYKVSGNMGSGKSRRYFFNRTAAR
jgi:hypothetical protein